MNKFDERNKRALEQIGHVDMNKVPDIRDKEAEREDDINEAMLFLEDFTGRTIDPHIDSTLNQWEEEFIDSISGYIARGYRLTDGQFEKLLQIKVKYE